METLGKKGQFTFFAPNDEAFEALDEATRDVEMNQYVACFRFLIYLAPGVIVMPNFGKYHV
jgi:hypothetical protein